MEYSVGLLDSLLEKYEAYEDSQKFIERYQSTICSLMQVFEQNNVSVGDLWTLKKIVDTVFGFWDQSTDDFIYEVCLSSIIAYYEVKNTEASQLIAQKIKNLQTDISDQEEAFVHQTTNLVISKVTNSLAKDDIAPNNLCQQENGGMSKQNRRILTNVLKYLYTSVQTWNLSAMDYIIPTVSWINNKSNSSLLKIIGIEEQQIKATQQVQKVFNVLCTIQIQ